MTPGRFKRHENRKTLSGGGCRCRHGGNSNALAINDLSNSTAQRDDSNTSTTIGDQALYCKQIVQIIRNSEVIARSLEEKICHVGCASNDIAISEIVEELLELDILTSEVVDVSIAVKE
jgi:hypothetical protein